MFWSQELKLLNRLSNATCLAYFTERQSKIEKLRLKVAYEVRTAGSARLLSDSQFNEKLFAAAASGLKATTETLETKGCLTPGESSCMSALLNVMTVLLGYGVAMSSLDFDIRAVTHALGSTPASVAAMLATAQTAIKQTGYIDVLTKACAALAGAVRTTLLQVKTPAQPAAAQSIDSAAINSIATALLQSWCDLGAVWAAISRRNLTAEALEQSEMYQWSDPELLVTIPSSFGLVMALLRLEGHRSNSCKQEYAATRGVQYGASVLRQGEGSASLWTAIIEASSQISSTALRIDQSVWCADRVESATAVIKQTVLSSEVQELQLFVLAAVAGSLQQRPDGIPPAEMPRSSAAAVSSSDTHRSRDECRQHKQVAADCSAQVLQQLNLTAQQGQQFVNIQQRLQLADPKATLEGIQEQLLGISIIILGYSCRHDRLFTGTTASTIALLKVQLIVQATVLMPRDVILARALIALFHACFFWNRDWLSHGYSKDTIAAVTAAVADDIFAPLLLEVVPALVQNKKQMFQPWAYMVGYFWSFLHHNKQGRIIKNILQRQPSTALTVLEAVIRQHMSTPLPASTGSLFQLRPDGLGAMPELVETIGSVLANDPALQVTISAAALRDFSTSSSSSSSYSGGWPLLNSKSLAAKWFSLLISCLKLLNKFAADDCEHEAIEAVNTAFVVFDAAKNVAAAVVADPSRPAAAFAMPWIHLAVRALHSSWGLLFWSNHDASKAGAEMYSRSFRKLFSFDREYSRTCWTKRVGWCHDQLVVLTGHVPMDSYSHANTTTSSSHNSTGCDSTSASASAFPLSKGFMQQVLKQGQQLKDTLEGKRQQWPESHGFQAEPPDVCSQIDQQDSVLLFNQLQQYTLDLCAGLPTLLCCNNPSCSTVSSVSELSCVGRRKCSKCQAAGYCSRECQKQHWSQHKKVCG